MSVTVTYTGPSDEVVIVHQQVTYTCKRGETVTVPDDLANGTPAVAETEDTPGRPGTSGLLAQSDIWQLAKKPPTPKPSQGSEETKP